MPPHGGRGRLTADQKAKDFKGTLGKTLRYLGHYKIALLFVVVFALGSTVFNIIGPKIMSEATTELFNGLVAKVNGTGGIDFEAIGFILLLTLGLYGLSAACSFVQGWLMTGVSQRLCFKLRQDIAEKINRMPFGFFDANSTGDTLSRITNDVDTLGQSLNQSLTQLVTSVATLIGVVVMMVSINVPMTLITLCILPVSLVFIVFFVRISQKHFEAQQALLGEVNNIVEETVSGHAVMKAFNKQDATARRFSETNDRLYNAAWKAQYFSSFMKPTMDFISNAAYVGVAIVGSFFAVQGIITVGDIQAFIQYVKNFTQPLSQISMMSNVLQQLAAAAERIFDFLEQPEEPLDVMKATEATAEETIEFDHVSFGSRKASYQEFLGNDSPRSNHCSGRTNGCWQDHYRQVAYAFLRCSEGRYSLGWKRLA